MDTTTNTTPRVYIACLASYNAGILHGKWADAIDADDLRASIDDVLKTSPIAGAEEYAIHDYDGIPSTFGEWPDVDELCKLGALLDSGDVDVEAWSIFWESDSFDSVDNAYWAYRESYIGERDLVDYAEELFDELYGGTEAYAAMHHYIDYSRFARELEIDGYWEQDGHLFGPY